MCVGLILKNKTHFPCLQANVFYTFAFSKCFYKHVQCKGKTVCNPNFVLIRMQNPVTWLNARARVSQFPQKSHIFIFHKRATKYRSLLRKITYKDKGSCESSPPCTQEWASDEERDPLFALTICKQNALDTLEFTVSSRRAATTLCCLTSGEHHAIYTDDT